MSSHRRCPRACKLSPQGAPQQPFIDLSWAPDTESDLAGYNVYRHEEGAAPVKINSDVVKAPTYRDTAVQAGRRTRIWSARWTCGE